MAKLSALGSIATIIGLGVSLTSNPASSIENLQVNGQKNTVVGEVQGDMNIDYGDKITVVKNAKGYVLRNPMGGTSLVVTKPNLDAVMNPNMHVCETAAGMEVKLTGRSSSMSGLSDHWREVQVLSGVCSGKVGWVSISNLSYE